MKKVIKISIHVESSSEKQYLQVPFTVPEDVSRIDIEYDYIRHRTENTQYGQRSAEVNIIDIGLHAPNDDFVGTSGSNRKHIWISESNSSLGYSDRKTVAGQWNILLGAYKVEPQGVDVEYTVTFTMKERKLYFGDTHVHSLASDGNMFVPELAKLGKKVGMDFIFTTDHNNYSQNYESHNTDGITVIPGCEWTHYNGHINFYGVKRPVQSAFPVNSEEEAIAVIHEAKANGALISPNHPHCPNCGWRWSFGLDFDYDMVELWNGATMPNVNMDTVNWWHDMLCKGKKIPAVCGSDFHSLEPFRLIGQPVLGVYANSANPSDILDAMKNGQSFLACDPGGAKIMMQSGEAILGGTSKKGEAVKVVFSDLLKGDVIRFITNTHTEEWICEDGFKQAEREYSGGDYIFARFEIYRPYSPYGMNFPILISNPIYFD